MLVFGSPSKGETRLVVAPSLAHESVHGAFVLTDNFSREKPDASDYSRLTDFYLGAHVLVDYPFALEAKVLHKRDPLVATLNTPSVGYVCHKRINHLVRKWIHQGEHECRVSKEGSDGFNRYIAKLTRQR